MRTNDNVLKTTELCGRQFTVYGTPAEPLFKAADIAQFIGHTDTQKMLRTIDDEEKLMRTIFAAGQNRQVWMLTENGLYEVLMQSRKPIAKEFKKGVKAILKEIRTQGGYMVAKVEETPEQLMARALTIANATLQRQNAMLADMEKKNMALTMANETLAEKNSESEQVIEQLKPGAAFANAVATSAQSCLIGELAVILKQNGVDIGQNRLFEWMRKNGYLCSSANLSRYNQPTQKAMDLQLFEIKKTTITMPSGETIVKVTPKVTGKGQIYFVNKFLYNSASGKAQKPSGENGGGDK